MTVSNLQHSRQRNLGTYQPRQLVKQLRQQAEVQRDQLLSAANVIDGLCEKVETRREPPPNTGCVPLQGITYYEESAVPAKCDRCNAVYLSSPTTGLQMLNKCPQCFGPLVAVQEQEQR
jgi:hypothetical protein